MWHVFLDDTSLKEITTKNNTKTSKLDADIQALIVDVWPKNTGKEKKNTRGKDGKFVKLIYR